MKIVEDYAQRKVDENTEKIILNMNEKGLSIEDISKFTDVSIEFVKKTLSK